MTRQGWLLYGANGFTGQLIAEEAVRRGLRPVLAGRDAKAVTGLADRLGLASKVFSLEDDVERAIDGFAAVVLAAGPFSGTSARMVEACIATGTHYLDINGDISVFEQIFARAAEAEQRGCVLLPGVGFDVVPTDCVAATLAAALPDGDRLDLAWGGDLAPSQGTSKATLEIVPRGGAIRESGAIRIVPTGWKTMRVPFATGPALAVTVPWGDVSTAYRSTKIPNIAVYAAMPRLVILSMRVLRPFFALLRIGFIRRALGRVIEWTVRGPDVKALANGRTYVWGRVTNPAGEARTATLSGPDGYRLSALATVEAVTRVMRGDVRPGAHTPSSALGPAFVEQLPGCGSIMVQPAT
jgi:saccharopine dehydrogenase (NAD+, L-lysine-forming)